MNAPVSGVGPTQQPAQIVAPAIPEQRSVAQPSQAQRPSAQVMTQQAVQLFNGIFQLHTDLNYANGVTYEQVQGKVSKELFDLIANGMKTSNEVQGSDNTITADEIEGFISNVAIFMQMAQLDPNDPTELARVARLYNKNGGQYTRVNISDFQQIRGLIEQNWTTASATDPYEKAAQVVGNEAQASKISPMLDMISRKLNRADYKDAQPEGQKSVLSAFLLASSLQMDIVELYGMGEIERIDHTDDGGQVTLTAHNQANRGAPVISLGSEAITAEEVGSLMKANMDKEIKSEAGLVLGPKGKAQMIFQSLVAGKAVPAFLKGLAVSNVTEEEAKTWLSKQQGSPPPTPENIEIARTRVFAEKCEKDKELEAEATQKLGQSMDALYVTDMEGLVTSINSAIADPAQQVTPQDINGWIDEAKKGMRQMTEMMQASDRPVNPSTSVSSSISTTPAPGTTGGPAADKPTVSDAPKAEADPVAKAVTTLFGEYKATPRTEAQVKDDIAQIIARKDATEMKKYSDWFRDHQSELAEANKGPAKLFAALVGPAGIVAPFLTGDRSKINLNTFQTAISGLSDAQIVIVADTLYSMSKSSSLLLNHYLTELSGSITRSTATEQQKQVLKVTDELWTRYFEDMARSTDFDATTFISDLKTRLVSDSESVNLSRAISAVPEDKKKEVQEALQAVKRTETGELGPIAAALKQIEDAIAPA